CKFSARFSLGEKFDTSTAVVTANMFYGCTMPEDFDFGSKFEISEDMKIPERFTDGNSGKPDYVIMCNTFSGGKDLYMGIPEMNGATIVSVSTAEDTDYYKTDLLLHTRNGKNVLIRIKQSKDDRCILNMSVF
ncbi:MAG: hypothetical protein NC309_08535, partial [Ruminococcus sp.]|nr:hypothetical protein [Ruminococcus sp.]